MIVTANYLYLSRLPLAAIIISLLWLHRRHNQKLRREDATDPHKDLDFGLGDAPVTGKGGKRRSMMMMGGGKEKDHGARFKQMSMDLNMSSPYLLPPGMQGSRESIQSLAKSIDPHHDPYRPVAQLAADNASIRSTSRGPPESLYAASSHEKDIGRSRSPNGAGAYNARQNSFPKPPVPTAEQKRMEAQSALPELSIPAPAKDPFRSPSEMSRPSIDSAHFPDEQDFVAMPAAPEIQEPAPATQRTMDRPVPENQPVRSDSGSSSGVVQHDYTEDRHRSQQAVIHERGPSVTNNGPLPSPPQEALPVSPQPQRPAEQAAAAPILEEPQEYYDFDNYAEMPQGDYEQQGHHDDEQNGRGRSVYRDTVTSVYDQEPQPTQGGLGVPQQDGRRLSVGFRPLPPDELMDNEDPETRANRIRSFYKEYFDDSAPKPDVPEVPQQYFAAQQQQRSQQQANRGPGSVNYYEDYNQNYGGHGAEEPYYDPDTNSFVMPYAQPVARRAMTPPPSGSRFNGPRGPPGPPRGMHGSMGGGMGMPGPRGPGYGPGYGSRPGSGASGRYGPPRPGSAMSQGNWGNRPRGSTLSALSGARNGPPKKQLPPPSDLTTLPTPSKLKDDSFALFNAADFAPPELFKDRARGRSQSPMGERRPYQVTVPAHSPLVNAFEELPSIPSP
jgi:hypothetical protein